MGNGDAAERSLTEDLRRLAADAAGLAQAEAEYQKSRVAFAAGSAKTIALLVLLAAVLVFFALMALTLGLVLALTPLIGAWLATAAVVGGLLLIAAICVVVALSRWKWMMTVLGISRNTNNE